MNLSKFPVPVQITQEILNWLKEVGIAVTKKAEEIINYVVTYGWPVMVKQAWTEGIIFLTATLSMLTIAITLGIISLKFYQKADKIRNAHLQTRYPDPDNWIAGSSIFGFFAVVATVVALIFLVLGIGRLLNPDYYAAVKIVEMIKTAMGK